MWIVPGPLCFTDGIHMELRRYKDDAQLDASHLQCVHAQSPRRYRPQSELWATAHAAASGILVSTEQEEGFRVASPLLSLWSNFSTITTLMVSSAGGHCIAYSDVWKGGNRAIHETLQTRESEKFNRQAMPGVAFHHKRLGMH